jgi:probable HAF family extracellular repeat protein
MRSYVSLLLLALVAALLVPISATAQYIATELPPLPGDGWSSASGINAAGEVVGSSGETAVVWDRDGNPFALPTPPDYIVGACAINSSGVTIGGTTCGIPWYFRGVVWDRHGNPTVLPPLLGGDAFASDINASGLIVGGEVDRNTWRPFAVFWDRDGNPVELPRFDSYQIGSGAYGINNAGKIVGSITMEWEPGRRSEFPVVWDRHGNPTVLPVPSDAGRYFRAVSISERGEVVGISSPPRGVTHAFVWDRDGNIRELPPLPGDAGAYLVGGKIINVRGEVVGASRGSGSWQTATVWDSDGNPTALPFLGPNDTDSYASGINAAGEIVGTSFALREGIMRAVVWRPDRRGAP